MDDFTLLRRASEDLFFVPDDGLLKKCCKYLKDSSEDIFALRAFNADGYPIYYVGGEISCDFCETDWCGGKDMVENRRLLKSLTSCYEMPNIQRKI